MQKNILDMVHKEKTYDNIGNCIKIITEKTDRIIKILQLFLRQ